MGSLKRFTPTGILLLLAAYFGFHALQAEHGPAALMVMNQRIAEAESELSQTRAYRADLEDQVARLSPGHDKFDIDFVTERTRDILKYAHPDEVILRVDTPT